MRAHHLFPIAFASIALFPFLACRAQTLVVGGTTDGGPSDATIDGMGVDMWSGYFQGAKLPSGSDHIDIAFTQRDSEGARGSVFLGDPPADPPPTDPSVGYPTRLVSPSALFPYGAGRLPPDWEKFAFTVDGAVDGARVTFGIDQYEKYAAWCDLQTHTYANYNLPPPNGPTSSPGYACEPDPSPNCVMTPQSCACAWQDDAGPHSMDCLKAAICQPGGACTCTQTRCMGSFDAAAPIANNNHSLIFDLRVDGNTLTGTVVGLPYSAGPVNVYLTRQ